MATWINVLNDNPLPWLLEENTPAVRRLALHQLLDQPENAPDVRHASAAEVLTCFKKEADPVKSL